MIANSTAPLYWSRLSDTEWPLYIAATDDGLCFIGSLSQPFEELTTWANKHLPRHQLQQDDSKLEPYAHQLTAYLHGQLQSFTLPLCCIGTPFQQAVWRALRNIPYGQTRTYTDIASEIEKPSAVRAVGSAIGANPVLITIPCHRVIGKNGALTGYRGGLDMKTRLLGLESGSR